jgi:RNA recognition motif-containing protein
MSNNIYLGNLPGWATADDIRSWLESSDLVCDSIRVIRDFETQASKGYAFVEAPNEEEMEAIIRRFNRAPIDGKLLRAKTAHPKGEKPAVVRGNGSSPLKRRKRRRDGDADGAPSENGERQSAKSETVGTLGEALQKAL